MSKASCRVLNEIITQRTLGGELSIPKSVNPIVLRELVNRSILDLLVNCNFVLGKFSQELDQESLKTLLKASETIATVIDTRYQKQKKKK